VCKLVSDDQVSELIYKVPVSELVSNHVYELIL
jgi:hypothetical protein